MDKQIKLSNGYTVTVVSPKNRKSAITAEDAEMDKRVKQAVRAEIDRLKVCKKPIARYDAKTGKAYLEYPDDK